ncbi:MAG: patatin-like phospholipase family protein [Tissierellia bacterium]|nr:patatin-like phospholipase family protein [Tissierellia bacterium]
MQGLVLEGGGAKGAFQVGAFKALSESGYEFDGITGTSIGSLNGAMLCQGDYENLEKLWLELDPEELFGYKVLTNLQEKEFNFDRIKDYSTEIKDMVFQGGIDIKPIYEYITKNIDETKIRNSNMDFGLVTYNLTDRKAEKLFIDEIDDGRLCDYLMASCYLPVFKREELGGKYYLDGGFADNLPFDMLINKGYKKLVLIRIDGIGFVGKAEHSEVDFFEIAHRQDLGKLLDFSHDNIKKLIRQGYLDTLVSLDKLFGEKYSIKGNLKAFTDELFMINDSKMELLSGILGFPAMEGMDKFYMYLLPKISEQLGIKGYPSSEKIALKLMETRMSHLDMDIDKIYEIEKFKDNLFTGDKSKKEREELLSINKIIQIFNKDELIQKISDILFTKS